MSAADQKLGKHQSGVACRAPSRGTGSAGNGEEHRGIIMRDQVLVLAIALGVVGRGLGFRVDRLGDAMRMVGRTADQLTQRLNPRRAIVHILGD